MNLSRYETTDTFIIADPMRTYAEEAEATLNNIYYKHLEAYEGDIRVFKREVFQHSSSWMWRLASLDSRAIPKK